MVKFEVNMKLLPMKAHYFLYNGGTAPVVPFMPTYAKQLGFSTVIVGTLYTILPIAGMIAKPLFGAIADRYRLHKQFFLLFLALTGVLFFGINFIPQTSLVDGPGANLDCSVETLLRSCGHSEDNCAVTRLLLNAGNLTSTCHISCPQVNSSDWDVALCNTWKIDKYCLKSSNSHKLEFTAKLPLYHTEMIKDCLYFRVQTVELESRTVTPYCNELLTTRNCQAKCDIAAVTDILAKKSNPSDEEILKTPNFWFFTAALLTSWIAMAVVVSVGDAICFEMLGDKPENYGLQRLWGAVGWGISSIIAGFLVDEFSKDQDYKNYSVVFYMTLSILAVDFLVSSRLKVSQTKMSSSIVRDVGRLLSEVRINLFLLWCVAVGMCTGLLWNFLFWHLEDLATTQGCETLAWIKTLQGLVMGVQCFGGELLFFFISGWVIKKIGHIHAMTLVLFGFGVRFLLYSVLTNPWLVLPVELLNGVTFGIFYATMTSYASIVAPPGTEATVQGLVGAVFEGVGLSCGSLIGGVIYNKHGGAFTFRVFGIGSLVLFIIHAMVQYFLSRRDENIRMGWDAAEVKDFPMTARYAAPNDAIQMLED